MKEKRKFLLHLRRYTLCRQRNMMNSFAQQELWKMENGLDCIP